MNAPAASLGTKIARRLLGLFLLCALAPVAATIAVAYGRVQSALVDERIAQLGQAAESYGTTLFERLSLAEQLAASIPPTGLPAERRAELGRYFSAVVVLLPNVRPRVLLGEGDSLPSDLPPHADSAIALEPGTHGSRGVWLVRTIANGTLLAARINPQYLWGAPDELPYLTELCVLDSNREPLHCTATLPAEALARLRDQLARGPAGHSRWEGRDSAYVSSFRELFLQAKFAAGSWPLVLSQPESHALAPVSAIRGLVLPVVALGLLAAALMGLVQVRRLMDPLQSLSVATHRIAERDFGTRVPVTSDDEFGALADAFNTMSERLGRQFQALGALAQIDSVILSKVDIGRIATIVLERMKEVAGANSCLLLLRDEDVAGAYRACTAEGTPREWHGRTIVLDAASADRLADMPQGWQTSASQPVVAPLAEFAGPGQFVLPIVLDRRLEGLFVIAHPEGEAPDADRVALLRDLADRVAVALATAARDLELHRRAHYDPLTRLPNRLMFLDELARELVRADRLGTTLALLFIDLDGFSEVNDTLGHAAGDELLVHAADRLRGCLRKADLVARLGGDEFTVVCPDLAEAGDAGVVARHLIETLSQPYDIGHGETFVAASIGIAAYPADGATAPELLRHADMAMYRAKQKGRGNHVFFEEEMNREAQQRRTLDGELRRALESDQFVLYYQPQLELASNRIVGAEALLRWRHPTRGLIAPGPFIGFAEETGLIERIGAWVLADACTRFASWRADGLPIGHVSVNVSPRQFRNRDFAQAVARVVQETGLDPHALRLEITESVLVDGSVAAEATLAQLAMLGTPLELDDFGTGYSSLAYLQRLPVDTIKLDRSFITGIATSDNARAIARAAISMVHALKKKIVAEGVETQEQLALLRQWGCDAIQGYLFSAPLPADDFAEFVRATALGSEARRTTALASCS